MKLRTDFVTNSSASSFIFTRKLDADEIIKMGKKVFAGTDELDFWEAEWSCTLESAAAEFAAEILPFAEREVGDIFRIIDWYEYNIYGMIFDIFDAAKVNVAVAKKKAEEFFGNLDIYDVTPEQLKKLSALIAIYYTSPRNEDDKTAANYILTRNGINAMVFELWTDKPRFLWYYKDVRAILRFYPEGFRKYALEFEGKNSAELFHYVTNGAYMFGCDDGYWCYGDLGNVLKHFDECVLWDPHMG